MVNSPVVNGNVPDFSQPGPSRHVSFSSFANSTSPSSNIHRRLPILGGTSHVGGSRPTSGPVMVESILEEEALARKGE